MVSLLPANARAPGGSGWHWRLASALPTLALLAALLAIASLTLPSGPAWGKDSPPPRQSGLFVRLTLPVTGQTFERTRRIVRRAIEKRRKKTRGWC